MIPEVAKFTRANPCTKVMIWNCFRRNARFVRVQVAVAKSLIGANVPRDMIVRGRLNKIVDGSVEYYELTLSGAEWLREGMRRYLHNHPEAREQANFLPRPW